MRLALISGTEDSAIDSVFQDLKVGLAQVRPDWTVDLVRFRGRPLDSLGLDNYDICHIGYIGYPITTDYLFNVPVTANIWHIRPHKLGYQRDALTPMGYSRFVVDDMMTLQMLGQIGFTNVVPIPMAFNPDRFSRLAPPATDFTVGCFGDNFDSKRFGVIVNACREAGVRGYFMILPVDRPFFILDPLEDVYAQVHVLAHASFTDTNFRPGLEALACGIPIISTLNDGLRRVANGGNVTFYDGSVKDLASKINEVREKLAWHREAAAFTQFPDLKLIAMKYAFMWEQVLEEQS